MKNKTVILCVMILLVFSVFTVDWFREDPGGVLEMKEAMIELPEFTSPPPPPIEYCFPIHPDDFVWDGVGGDLTSPFGERDPIEIGGLGNGFHRGLDLWGVSHIGTWQARVVAVADGIILNHWYNHLVYGKMIEILHDDGSVSMYAHLSVSYVHEKRIVDGKLIPWKVKKGDVIGRIGKTGDFYPDMKTHLHFELRINDQPVNPLKYIKIPEEL